MDHQDIIRSLEYSSMAYSDIQASIPGERLITIDNKVSGIQCSLRISGDVLDVAFRGTDSLKDWITDFKFWRKIIPYNNLVSKIRVHSGFLQAYKNDQIRGRILSYVSQNIHYIKVTGHSYGAAVAVLCAVDLQYNFPSKDYEVILFGCPRVGNRAFAKSYDKRLFKTLRIENGNDIVTKVPPAMIGYRHVGIPIHIGGPRLPFVITFMPHKTKYYYEKLWKL